MYARPVALRPISGMLLLMLGIWLRWQSPFSSGLTRAFLVDIALVSTALFAFTVLSVSRRLRDVAGNDTGAFDSFVTLIKHTLPLPVAHIALMEIAVWASIWRLISKRGRVRVHELTYHRHSSMAGLILLTIVTAPAEILLFELVVPWSWLRLLFLGLALYGACWLIGMFAGPRAFPHEMLQSGLVLRSGATTRWFVPWTAIETVEQSSQEFQLKGNPNRPIIDGTRGDLIVTGRTNVTITLRHTLRLDEGSSVGEIRFFVDEPSQFLTHYANRETTRR